MIACHKYSNNNNIITHRQHIEQFCVTKETILHSMNPNNNMNNDNNLLFLDLLAEASTILPATTITNTTEARENSKY